MRFADDRLGIAEPMPDPPERSLIATGACRRPASGGRAPHDGHAAVRDRPRPAAADRRCRSAASRYGPRFSGLIGRKPFDVIDFRLAKERSWPLRFWPSSGCWSRRGAFRFKMADSGERVRIVPGDVVLLTRGRRARPDFRKSQMEVGAGPRHGRGDLASGMTAAAFAQPPQGGCPTAAPPRGGAARPGAGPRGGGAYEADVFP